MNARTHTPSTLSSFTPLSPTTPRLRHLSYFPETPRLVRIHVRLFHFSFCLVSFFVHYQQTVYQLESIVLGVVGLALVYVDAGAASRPLGMIVVDAHHARDEICFIRPLPYPTIYPFASSHSLYIYCFLEYWYLTQPRSFASISQPPPPIYFDVVYCHAIPSPYQVERVLSPFWCLPFLDLQVPAYTFSRSPVILLMFSERFVFVFLVLVYYFLTCIRSDV